MLKFQVLMPTHSKVLRYNALSFIPQTWPLRLEEGPQKHFFKCLAPGAMDCEWIIACDEDCYLIDPPAILELLDYMQANGYHFAGMQDGGAQKVRTANPVMINPFFAVFHVPSCQGNYPHLPNTVALTQPKLHSARFHDTPYRFGEFEQYYSIFAAFLEKGLKPLYFKTANAPRKELRFHHEEDFPPTIILDELDRPLAIHSWFARFWNEDREWILDRLQWCHEYATTASKRDIRPYRRS